MIAIDDRVQLLLDDFLIEEKNGIERVMHDAVKHPSNPLLVADRLYESPFGPQLYGSVQRDMRTGEFRMWYQSHRGKYLTLATSGDGVRWQKPELGLQTYDGSTANNILLVAPGAANTPKRFSDPSVVLDPDAADPEQRFKMFYYGSYTPRRYPKGGLFVATSPDGLRWSTTGNEPVMHQIGDVPDVVWDPLTRRMVCHNKLNHWEGDQVDENGRRTGRHISCYITPAGWTRDTCPIRFSGEILIEGEETWRTQEFLLDPSTVVGKRAIGRAESQDGCHWSPQHPIFRAGPDDPPDQQFHGMPAWRAGDIWIGMLQNMRREPGDGHSNPDRLPTAMELAYSRDDHTWHRFAPTRMILPLGPEGSWDGGRIDGATQPVIVGEFEYYYYAACPIWSRDQWWRDTHQLEYSIGLATWRREGYVSLHAPKDGAFLTRPLRLDDENLYLNIDARDGQAEVHLVKADGAANAPIAQATVSKVDQTRCRLRWDQADVRRFLGRPLRLRVRLRNAHLYSFVVGTSSSATD